MTTLVIIAGVFTFTIIPPIALVLHALFAEADFFESMYLHSRNTAYYSASHIVFTMVFWTNSLCNYFIYSARDKCFRDASKKIYMELLCQRHFCISCHKTDN